MRKVALMLLIAIISMAVIGSANAGTVISGELSGNVRMTKTGWTINGVAQAGTGHPYHLQGIVYVIPGATLTIEKGVVFASYATAGTKGAMVVCRDADIYINGTAAEPVIFTSAEDVATWTGSVVDRTGGTPIPDGYGGTVNAVTNIITMGDSKTGYWRPCAGEWGSLAVLGKGYISASEYKDTAVVWDKSGGGTQTNFWYPNALNRKRMEGTTLPANPNQERVLYGGDDDEDCSGSISYVSFRYGGFDLAAQDELNGLSLGAVGRGTDVHHIDIMNNVDDGIEIWGGAVEIDHVNIWNIGDDSLDFDEGWRGSARYGLIVQGYSQRKKQGSGMGDNCLEMDGAEEAYVHPMTTVRIEKFTCVGQPGTDYLAPDGNTYTYGGDAATAWRDNARVQIDKCLFMDGDEDQLILFDNSDTDGASGYDGTSYYQLPSGGYAGNKYRTNSPFVDNVTALGLGKGDRTMNWREHWTTSYNTWKTLTGSTSFSVTQGGAAGGTYNPLADNMLPYGCPALNFTTLYENYMTQDVTQPLCNMTNCYSSGFKATGTSDGYYIISGYAGNGLSGNNVSGIAQPLKELVRDPAHYFTDDSKKWVVYPVMFINPLPKAGVTTAGGFENGENWIAGWTAASAYGMTEASADLNGDGSINFDDLATFGNQWLQ